MGFLADVLIGARQGWQENEARENQRRQVAAEEAWRGAQQRAAESAAKTAEREVQLRQQQFDAEREAAERAQLAQFAMGRVRAGDLQPLQDLLNNNPLGRSYNTFEDLTMTPEGRFRGRMVSRDRKSSEDVELELGDIESLLGLMQSPEFIKQNHEIRLQEMKEQQARQAAVAKQEQARLEHRQRMELARQKGGRQTNLRHVVHPETGELMFYDPATGQMKRPVMPGEAAGSAGAAAGATGAAAGADGEVLDSLPETAPIGKRFVDETDGSEYVFTARGWIRL